MPQAVELEARASRAEGDARAAREAQEAAEARERQWSAQGSTIRAGLEATEEELGSLRHRLEAAATTEAELRGRCEDLSLASAALTAEVKRQKEERAKWQEHSRLAAASATELRKRCAELMRASEASGLERARLERELSNARSESQEIDADVAQVLEALAVSERERRSLEAELQRQSKIARDARQAMETARGEAAETKRGLDRERTELSKEAGRIEGVVQAGASRLRESLETERKRRAELERERKTLASRVADLEGALLSASSEVRKAAKLAAERGAEYERETTGLNEEIGRLRAALRAETTNVREALQRAAEERRRWDSERALLQGRAARREEDRERREELRERQELEIVSLRKESGELTEALKAETSRATQALAREASLRAIVGRRAMAVESRIGHLTRGPEEGKPDSRGLESASHEPRRSTSPPRPLRIESGSMLSGAAATGGTSPKRDPGWRRTTRTGKSPHHQQPSGNDDLGSAQALARLPDARRGDGDWHRILAEPTHLTSREDPAAPPDHSRELIHRRWDPCSGEADAENHDKVRQLADEYRCTPSARDRLRSREPGSGSPASPKSRAGSSVTSGRSSRAICTRDGSQELGNPVLSPTSSCLIRGMYCPNAAPRSDGCGSIRASSSSEPPSTRASGGGTVKPRPTVLEAGAPRSLTQPRCGDPGDAGLGVIGSEDSARRRGGGSKGRRLWSSSVPHDAITAAIDAALASGEGRKASGERSAPVRRLPRPVPASSSPKSSSSLRDRDKRSSSERSEVPP